MRQGWDWAKEVSSSGKILIIIPAFNEEKRIAPVIVEVRERLPMAEILIVDDGSRDKTRQNAEAEGVKVISHPYNLGYGTALQTGYKYALKEGYDAIVQLDGDGQHDPSSIADLLASLQKGEADIVIGSRFLNARETESGPSLYRAPFTRKVGMELFGTITSLLIHEKITDSTSGYQAMNRKVLEWVSSDKFPCDYPDADVIIMLHRAGFRIREIPVRMFPSQNEKSMHSGWKPLYYIFKMFLSILVTLMRK
jgi:glycosyltransferase involved in cell wall biosynthesis